MPVIHASFLDRRWPGGRIPYKFAPRDGQNISVTDGDEIVQNMNAEIGVDLFVPLEDEETYHVKIDLSASQSQSTIGYVAKEAGFQWLYLNASRTKQEAIRSLYHELGHCLGLCHEQNHVGYPILDSEVLTRLDAGGIYLTADRLIDYHAGKGVTICPSRSLWKCDLGSIMMYSEFEQAARGRPFGPIFTRTGPDVYSRRMGVLSQWDRIAISYLYDSGDTPPRIESWFTTPPTDFQNRAKTMWKQRRGAARQRLKAQLEKLSSSASFTNESPI